ncbi:MAG: pyridoxamine 5'-phosphate oxidase family protein [Chloroflexi bacterium]|nr:pyridoxamine 5'-phosphate oxidase family protein [Chloroflexota bacterium]
MPARLTKEEAHEFLDSRPGWLILTTIGRDGYPHSIPIGYFRLGDEIYVGGRDGTQRAKNIERNPKVSALVESGGTMQEIKGLMI